MACGFVCFVLLCVGDSAKEEGEDPAGVLASGASATAGTSTSTGTGTNMAPSTADDMVCWTL
jgi:hypothetical protein